MELTKYDWILGTLVAAAIVSFIFLVPFAMADQTVKTVEIPIGYIVQTTIDTDYIQTITIKPPDGIEELHFFEIIITGDFQASTDISARVRKTGTAPVFDCTPSTWTIPSIDSANYEASFDCSALADEYDFTTGKIDVGFRTSKVAQNVKGFVRMTYYNQPKLDISIFGTEYTINDIQGKVFLQLLNESSKPLSNSSCFLSIFNPDNSIWINETPMSNLELDGLYYKTFNIPNTTGVYMASAYCYIPRLEYNLTMNDTQTEDWETGNWSGGTGWSESQWTTDGSGGTIVTDTNSPHNGSYHLKMKNDERWAKRGMVIEGDDLNISFWAKCDSWESGEEVYVQLWDGAYNIIYTFNESCDDDTYHYYSFLVTTDDYKLGNNILRFMTSPTFGDFDYFYVDDIILRSGIRTYYFGEEEEEYQEIRGSGEVHITESVITFDEIKFVSGTEYTSGESGKIIAQFLRTVAGSPTPINDENCNISIYYPNETKFVDNQMANYITGSNGLYSYDFTVPDTLGLYSSDYKCTKKGVKSYGSSTFHVYSPPSPTVNTTAISEDVWEYPTRNLTYYPSFNYQQMSEYVWNYSDRQVNLTEVLEAVDALNDSTQSYFVVIENDILGLANVSTFEIWNYTIRTLTPENKTAFRFVGGTEYASGETGKAMVQILKEVPPPPFPTTEPINDAICNIWVIYPNGTLWLNGTNMTYINNSDGIYVYEFTVPDDEGVYLGQGRCIIDSGLYHASGSFHVSNWANRILGLNNLTASEIWSYSNRTLTNFSFTINCADCNTSAVLEAVNNLENYTIGDIWEYPLRNLTFYPAFNYSEMSLYIWNASSRELTFINFTEVLDRIDLANTTIINEIHNLNLTCPTCNFTQVLEAIGNLENITVTDIWEHPSRNLTLYPAFDYNQMSLYVWNATSRTLTDYNLTEILNYLLQINITTWDTNYWVKQNNDVLVNLTLGNVTVFANINWSRLREEVWNKTSTEKLEHDILSFADDEIVLVETRDFCTDNTTLMHQLNVTRCILSFCWDDNTENPEVCDWGCFENKCRPDPMWSNLWLILIIILIGVSMYVVNAVVK